LAVPNVILSAAHADVKCPMCGHRFADHEGVTVEVSSSVPPGLVYASSSDIKKLFPPPE
jgi:hypothetical protein